MSVFNVWPRLDRLQRAHGTRVRLYQVLRGGTEEEYTGISHWKIAGYRLRLFRADLATRAPEIQKGQAITFSADTVQEVFQKAEERFPAIENEELETGLANIAAALA